jgi:hypothetical protein
MGCVLLPLEVYWLPQQEKYMFVVTLKFVSERDKDEALEVLEEAEMNGRIMGSFDTEVDEVPE